MSLHEISNNNTLWAVGVFLLVTLAIGLYNGRGIKTFKEYVLANKTFGTGMLTLSFLATNFGGDILGDAGEVFNDGIIIFIAFSGVALSLLFTAFFIAPKIIVFKNALTMGDLMGVFFGKYAKIISGFLGSIQSICFVGMQLIILGILSEYLLNINATIAICVAGITFSIYSAFGGIKSVTSTDIFHFIIILIIIPAIASVALQDIGGIKVLLQKLPKEKLQVFSHDKIGYYITIFIIWCALPGISLSCPGILQRMLMAKSAHQIRNKYLMLSIFDPLFRIVVTLFGLIAIIKYPNLNSDFAIPEIFKNLSPFLRTLGVIGILALIVSTANSFLHAAGVAWAHDILGTILNQKKNKINELLWAKIFTFFIGLFSIIVAVKFNNVMQIGYFAIGLLYPLVTIPILSGVLGLKTDSRSFYIAFITTLFTYILSTLYLKPEYLTPVVSLGVNFITFFTVNILQNKGLVFVKREKESSKTTEKPWQPSIKKAFNWLYSFIPTPKKIFYFSRESVIKHGTFNIIFGIYCCVNFTLPYFMWDHEVKETYDFMIYLRLIGGVMAGLCIVKDEWKEFIKPYFPLFWHITLLFCLPFVTTLMFFLTHGSFTWLFNIATSIFFLILLVDGSMFCILGPLGVALGVGYYKWQFGPLNMSSLGFDTNYYLIYQILFPTIISLLFAYRKKFFYLIRGNQGVNLGLSLCHELRNTGLQALPSSQYLNRKALQMQEQTLNKLKGIYELDEKMMKFIISRSSEVEQHTKETIKVVSTFEKLLLEFRNSLSNPQICSIKSVVDYTLDEYSFLPGQKERVITRLDEDFYSKIPKEAFSFVLSNIIRNSYKHGRATEINLWLETQELHIRDNGQGIPASEITEIFKLFYTTGDQTSRGVGLAFAKQIVESFYGEIWCESEEGKNSYTEFIIKFPEVCVGEITDRSLHIAEKEGLLKGKNDSKKQIAIRMIIEGESAETIEKFTELSVSEIQELIRDHKSRKM